jgi:chromosome segregation ATPase
VIDHSEQTLEIRVSPSEKRGMAAETKSLSGGERSYATVSFIMALWDAIDPPFYFLDEFDVFMVRKSNTTVRLVIQIDKSGFHNTR